MNEHVADKLAAFAPFFGGAAHLHTWLDSHQTAVHAHCDNCTTCVDGTQAWAVPNSNLVLCVPCHSALRNLRQPADLERCKKWFRIHGLVGKAPRVLASRAYFEWLAMRNSQ
jgi:hypothetical protein